MMNTDNNILIITGGRIDDEFLLSQYKSRNYKMIIAVDHGLHAADRLNITPDCIIGDFDSVTDSLLDKFRARSIPIQTFPMEKDKTDTEIAIELAITHNPTSIDIVGATGSRMDHVLANIHLLRLPLQMNIRTTLLDSNNKIYLKDKNFMIKKQEQYGDYVSLLPFGDKVLGLTLVGFKYPLNHITYSAGSSLGVSNVILEQEARIELSEGILIVIESKD